MKLGWRLSLEKWWLAIKYILYLQIPHIHMSLEAVPFHIYYMPQQYLAIDALAPFWARISPFFMVPCLYFQHCSIKSDSSLEILEFWTSFGDTEMISGSVGSSRWQIPASKNWNNQKWRHEASDLSLGPGLFIMSDLKTPHQSKLHWSGASPWFIAIYEPESAAAS